MFILSIHKYNGTAEYQSCKMHAGEACSLNKYKPLVTNNFHTILLLINFFND